MDPVSKWLDHWADYSGPDATVMAHILAREVRRLYAQRDGYAEVAQEAVKLYADCDGARFGDGSEVFTVNRVTDLLTRLAELEAK